MNRLIPVLSVGIPAEDDAALGKYLADVADIHAAFNCREALEVLSVLPQAVVICGSVLIDGSWQLILERTQAMNCPPPVIVVSRLADEYLWAQVLHFGGYDVLEMPFDGPEVVRVVAAAWTWYRDGENHPAMCA